MSAPCFSPSPVSDRTNTAALGVQLLAVLQNQGQRENPVNTSSAPQAETCLGRDAPEEASRGACTFSCIKMCVCNASVSLIYLLPITTQTLLGELPLGGNQKKEKPQACGDAGACPTRDTARVEPDGVQPSPPSHRKPHGMNPAAQRSSCWHLHSIATLALSLTLEIQFPPSIWFINCRFSIFSPKPSSFLPFAMVWLGRTQRLEPRLGAELCWAWAASPTAPAPSLLPSQSPKTDCSL